MNKDKYFLKDEAVVLPCGGARISVSIDTLAKATHKDSLRAYIQRSLESTDHKAYIDELEIFIKDIKA